MIMYLVHVIYHIYIGFYDTYIHYISYMHQCYRMCYNSTKCNVIFYSVLRKPHGGKVLL